MSAAPVPYAWAIAYLLRCSEQQTGQRRTHPSIWVQESKIVFVEADHRRIKTFESDQLHRLAWTSATRDIVDDASAKQVPQFSRDCVAGEVHFEGVKYKAQTDPFVIWP